MHGQVVHYILATLPEYFQEFDTEESREDNYFAAARLYAIAVDAFAAGNLPAVNRILDLSEKAVSGGNPQIADAFAIEIFELLCSDEGRPHFQYFIEHLGPISRAEFENCQNNPDLRTR